MSYYIPGPISKTTCIGDSLSTINSSFSSLDTNLYSLSSYTHINQNNEINSLSASVQGIAEYVYNPVCQMAEMQMVYALPDNRLVLNNTLYSIVLNSVSFDIPGGMADTTNGKIVIKKSAYYEITVHASYEASGNPATRLAVLAHHTAYQKNMGWRVASEQAYIAGTYPIQENSRILYLNYNDIIRLDVYQNSGGTMVLKPENAYQVGLSVVEINPEKLEDIIPLFGRRVVGYGDSNTEGNVCGPANVYGEWLTSNFINRGVSGITADTISTSSLASIISDANINSDFVLAAGINDLGYVALPDVAVIATKIRTILNTARPLYRSITWITPSKTDYNIYAGNATVNANITALVNAVIALNITGIRIVRADLDSQIGLSSDPNNPLLKSDGLHYTRKGHKLLANLVYAAIV